MFALCSIVLTASATLAQTTDPTMPGDAWTPRNVAILFGVMLPGILALIAVLRQGTRIDTTDRKTTEIEKKAAVAEVKADAATTLAATTATTTDTRITNLGHRQDSIEGGLREVNRALPANPGSSGSGSSSSNQYTDRAGT